jgi:hypothetical protein
MKKLTLLLVATFSLFNTVSAQDDYTEDNGQRGGKRMSGRPRQSSTPWRFGVFLAPNISWMKPTNSKSNDGEHKVVSDGSKVGFTWGLMADYYFTDNYAIETGFQLNNTGGLISTTHTTPLPVNESYVSSTQFDYNLQFLEVPFNLKLISDEIGYSGVKLFGQLGVSAGINISKKATYVVNYYNVDNGQTETVTGEKERLNGQIPISPVMFNLNVGGGVEFPIGEKMSIYGGVIFNNGFAPDVTNPANYELNMATSPATTPVFRDGNTRQNNLAIRLGLIF